MFQQITSMEWIEFARCTMPMIVLLAVSCSIFLVDAISRRLASKAAPFMALIGIAAAFVFAWMVWPHMPGKSVMTIFLDRTSAVVWMIVCASAFFSIMLMMSTRKNGDAYRSVCCGFIMLTAFGSGVLASSANLLTSFISSMIIISSVSALIKIGKSSDSDEPAIKYFLMSVFAAAFFAMGMSFILGSVGTLDLPLVSTRSQEISSASTRIFFMFGVAMISVCFLFMIAAAPFHSWLPDVFEGSPPYVGVLVSTCAIIGAFIAFVRFGLGTMVSYDSGWHGAMWLFAAITMIFGCAAAARQDSLKRLLAYSVVMQSGIAISMLPSIAIGSGPSVGPILFYMFSSAFVVTGAMAAMMSIRTSFGELDFEINRLKGFAGKRPFVAASLSLFLLALAGFPPAIGFAAKYFLFSGVIKNGDLILAMVAAATTVASIYVYVRPITVMYFHERIHEDGSVEEIPALEPYVAAVLFIAAMTAIFFGILPGNLIAFLEASVP